MNREAIIHDWKRPAHIVEYLFVEKVGPHVEGNSNLGVMKIENFCCEEHRSLFLESS